MIQNKENNPPLLQNEKLQLNDSCRPNVTNFNMYGCNANITFLPVAKFIPQSQLQLFNLLVTVGS